MSHCNNWKIFPIKTIFPAALLAILSLTSIPAAAQNTGTPVCQLPDSDFDNDGWGWENNASCVVAGTQAADDTMEPATNFCLFASSDDDGDGWGWENNASCRVGADTSTEEPVVTTEPFVPVVDTSGRTICQTADADPDGDGYGWENNASCIVEGSVVETQATVTTTAFCSSGDVDPDGDGWGWENGRSCVVDADRFVSDNTDATLDTTPDNDTAADADAPTDTDTTTDTDTSIDTDTPADTDTADNSDTPTDTPTDSDAADDSDTLIDTDTIGDSEAPTDADTQETTTEETDAPIANIPAFLPADITDLILVTGQSNTLGSNSAVDNNLDAPHPRVFAYTSEGWQIAELYQSWDNGAHPGTGNRADVDKIHNNFALHFGKRMVELDEDIVVGFVLVSEPGEGINNWTPGEKGMLRVQQKTLAAINELPHKSAIDGILWHQGETDWLLEGTSDPDVTQPAPIDYYPMSLAALLDNLRAENWYDNTKPFICGETIQAEGVNTHLYNLNTDSDPQTACVEGAGLPAINVNGNHFSATALRTIGQRYADAYYLMR